MATCPCLISDEPCHPRCACVNPLSSRACWCCTEYGSRKQQKAAATEIIAACRRMVAERIEQWNRNIDEGHPERNASG